MKNIETTETVFGKGLTVNAAFDYATPALLDARSYVNRLEQMQEGEHDLFDNKLASGLLVYCAEDNKVYVFEGHDKNDNHRVWTALCTFDELNELGKFFNEQWTNLYNNTISDLYQKFGEINGIAQEGLGRVKELETFVDHFHTDFREFQSEVFEVFYKYVTWERIKVYLQSVYSTKEEINNTISEFYTSTVQTYINNKVTELTEQINNIDLSDYYNKTEIKNILEDFKSELADLADDLRWEYLLSIVPKDKSYESIRESVGHTSNPITGNYIKQYNLKQDLSKASKDEKLSSELKRLLKGDKPFFVLAQLTKNVGTVAAGEYTKCNFKCHIAHKFTKHTFDMDVSLLHVVTVNGEIKSCHPVIYGYDMGHLNINNPVTHEGTNNGVTRKYEYLCFGGLYTSAYDINNNIDINHDFKSNDVVGNYLIARVDNIYERDYDGISPDIWYVWEGERLADLPENTILFNSDKVELQISVDAEQDKDQRRELYTNGLILKKSNLKYLGLHCNEGIEYYHNKFTQRIDCNGFKQSFAEGVAPVGFNTIIAGVACVEENPERFGGNLKFCSVENRPEYLISNTPTVRFNEYKTFSVSPYGINPTYSVYGKHYEVHSDKTNSRYWVEDHGDQKYSYYCINLGTYDIPDNAILLASFNTLVRYEYDSEHPLQMMWAAGGEHWHGVRYLQTTILRNKQEIDQINGFGSQLVFAVSACSEAKKGIGAINYMLVTPN